MILYQIIKYNLRFSLIQSYYLNFISILKEIHNKEFDSIYF